ncbi:putative membrane protein, partial [Vibrio harveyi]
MKRIYLESFLGLIILFVASLIGYEIIVYQLNTDY